ncbi:hypothetical protein [Senegalia massiliensis]|uniref:hypothetical protein n=1 Tax=Senegalia massiliensis TaxID=1720316 RepID=UPI00103220F2|nr:hypothetical protein [Senegalia massiliensis]
MTVKEAKIEYNKLLKRYNKAIIYFDREDIPYHEKENQIVNFKNILKGLNYYLGKIGPHTSKETMGGFNVG